MTKNLRLMIWLNCLASILLALSVLVAGIILFNAPHYRTLYIAVSIISFLCTLLVPILGVSMVVMEILSRRDRSRNSVGGDDQAGSH